MIKIYIAGAYTKGDVAMNIKSALRVADYLVNQGIHPKVPHLTHFWHFAFPRPYEFWLAYDLIELEECHAVVRIEGASSGADKEVEHARKIGLLVHFFKGFDVESLQSLDEWIATLKESVRLKK